MVLQSFFQSQAALSLPWNNVDKNAHRLEESQEKFKEVQNAYEILSDKHERAWYDSHREQILKSGDRHQVICVSAWGDTRTLVVAIAPEVMLAVVLGPKLMLDL
jgi:hypothetical protein